MDADPVQLPLFPETVALTRIRPDRNEWRFYRMAVWPDLFGRALLARQWGRIGTQGRVRLDPHPDAGAAINALAQLARAKRRRGYRDHLARVHGRSIFGQIFEHHMNKPAFGLNPPRDDDLDRRPSLQNPVAFDALMATELCDRQSVDSTYHPAVTLKRSFVQQRISLVEAVGADNGFPAIHDTF